MIPSVRGFLHSKREESTYMHSLFLLEAACGMNLYVLSTGPIGRGTARTISLICLCTNLAILRSRQGRQCQFHTIWLWRLNLVVHLKFRMNYTIALRVSGVSQGTKDAYL